jgi:hypothetical protein
MICFSFVSPFSEITYLAVTTEILAGGVAPVSGVADEELPEEPPPPPLHPAQERTSIASNAITVVLVKIIFCGDFIINSFPDFLDESAVAHPAICLVIKLPKSANVNMQSGLGQGIDKIRY